MTDILRDDPPKDFHEGGDFIVYDSNGDLDDIALSDVTLFRMERMSTNTFWLRVYRKNGRDVVFWLGAEPNTNPHPRDPVPYKIVGNYDLDYDDEPWWKRAARKLLPGLHGVG